MIPYVKGKTTLQAHVDIPKDLCEEEYARSGFFGRYAHLYRSAPPIGWTKIEGSLKPRAFDTTKMVDQPVKDDFLATRKPILGNRDVRINFLNLTIEMPYFFRNADSDELYFVHLGKGTFETDFGPIHFEKGDYVLIPRGTAYRIANVDLGISGNNGAQLLLMESASEFNFPDKGMLGQHSLFDPALLTIPNPDQGMSSIKPSSEYHLKILREDAITTVTYPFCPLNTIGWKGTLSPWKLNVRDIRPVSCDRYHLPPSAHTTLVANNFVVCTFLPRPLENGDPNALKVPFYHSNIDYDEVLFYHEGDFFSRAGIKPGMITFHPQGIHHGPHPKAIERTKDLKYTHEIAVMIDTKFPLTKLGEANSLEVAEYWKSWQSI